MDILLFNSELLTASNRKYSTHYYYCYCYYYIIIIIRVVVVVVVVVVFVVFGNFS